MTILEQLPTVADQDLQTTGVAGRGGDHPDPEMQWGVGGRGQQSQKKNFSALRASVWPKNKGGAGGPGPYPGSAIVQKFEAILIALHVCTAYPSHMSFSILKIWFYSLSSRFSRQTDAKRRPQNQMEQVSEVIPTSGFKLAFSAQEDTSYFKQY